MGKHRNPKQEEVLLKFMTDHSDLPRGYVKGDRIAMDSFWIKLGAELYGFGPPIKDYGGWKKVWIDWKTSICKKLTHNRSEATATGEGDFNKIFITANENEVALICGFFKVVDGIKNAVPVGFEDFSSKEQLISQNSFDGDIPEILNTTEKTQRIETMKKPPEKCVNIPAIVEDEITAFNNIASKIDTLTEVILQGNDILKKLCESIENATAENRRHNLIMESMIAMEKKK